MDASALKTLYTRFNEAVNAKLGVKLPFDLWETMLQDPQFAKLCRKAANPSESHFNAALFMLMGAVIYSDPELKPVQTRGMYPSAVTRRKAILEHVNGSRVDHTHFLAMAHNGAGMPDWISDQLDAWRRSGLLTKDGRWKFAKYAGWKHLAEHWNRFYPEEQSTPDQLRERYNTAKENFENGQYIVSIEKAAQLVDWLTTQSKTKMTVYAIAIHTLHDWQNTDWDSLTPKDRLELRATYEDRLEMAFNAGTPESNCRAYLAWHPYIRSSIDASALQRAYDAVENVLQTFKEYSSAFDAFASWYGNNQRLLQLHAEDASALTDSDDTSQSPLRWVVSWPSDSIDAPD